MNEKRVTWQSLQEQESLLAVAKRLIPWRCSWIDGRDDFGRDGMRPPIEQKDPSGALLRAVETSLRIVDEGLAPNIQAATARDLRAPVIRKLLGLSADTGDIFEAIWDRALVGRLIHLNTAMAVAERERLDVVEYEPGLSRVAAEKWFDRLRHNRTASTAQAFGRLLQRTGVPDVYYIPCCPCADC